MKAVNLIPTEERRGTRTGGSGVGYASYVLLAVLALLVGGTYLYVSAGNTAKSRTAQIVKLKATVATEQAAASALRPYVDFATTAQSRIATVKGIADGRFSWYLAMRDLSRVLPRNVWLTSFTGTVAPGIAFGDGGGGGGSTGSLRSQMPSNPAVELSGCTVSNDAVARLLSRLRLINGVVRVSLAAASKTTSASPKKGAGGGDGSGAASGGDCRNGSDHFPQFSLVVFFKPMPTPPASVAATTGAPAAATSTTTPPANGSASANSQPAQSGQPAANGTSTTPGAATPTGSTPASTGATN